MITIKHIKRMAARFKKESVEEVSPMQALEVMARKFGHRNWDQCKKHYAKLDRK